MEIPLIALGLSAALLVVSPSPNDSPIPTTSSSPCAIAQRDPRPTSIVQADYPESARDQHYTGLVTVHVKLTAEGYVSAAEVTKSSNHGDLDNAALRAAVSTRYAPAIVDCMPVAGTYTFAADFVSQ